MNNGQINPPEHVSDLCVLEKACKLLTINHLGSIGTRTEWVGLETTETIDSKLKEMCDAGFSVSHVRRHCVSGVLISSLGNMAVEVVGICLVHPNGKGTRYYIDCLFTDPTKNSDETTANVMDKVDTIFGKYNWRSFGGTTWLGRNRLLGLADHWDI